jgi:hypothetical protein
MVGGLYGMGVRARAVGLIDVVRIQDWPTVFFIVFTLGFFIGCIIGYRLGLYKRDGGV